MKVLVADDDSSSLSLLERFLVTTGHEVLTATNGAEALKLLTEKKPDLVILDVTMPVMDGWEALAKIRASSQVPVIMLTGLDTPTDTIRGLLHGADDYLTKPVDLGVLGARITTVMRRYKGPSQSQILRVGELTLDDRLKEFKLRGQVIKLSPTEYELLKLLASEPGQVFSHEDIIKVVWANKPLISTGDVIRYIYLLREKLEKDPKNPELILTVRGFGYKLAS
ncbi:response regulator transcription factor [Candidatus Acetothermia bacterium]|nr:response regulator transcription factor [Candidatus Acetothermia bacterium]MBI3661102.1 response regulator transcription factor [Candidatus Acetothermia bacterium]